MSFLSKIVPTLCRRAYPAVFARPFGVEFSIHSAVDDSTIEVEVEKGANLLEVLQNEGVEITAVCSGGGSCGSCHVIMPKDLIDLLSPPNDLEKELLKNVVFEAQPTSRIACKVKVNDVFNGKVIEVPMPL